VTQGVGNTGGVGTSKGRRPGQRAIGLRADMDALAINEATGAAHASLTPGVMHACGHDGHTTMLLGAARYLAEHGPKLRPDTRRRSERRIKRYLSPAWGHRKAKDITRADVVALIKPLRAAGKMSEVVHVLSLVNGLFGFAVDDDELETITLNPEPIAPAALLAEIVHDWGLRFRQEGATASIDVADEGDAFLRRRRRWTFPTAAGT